jgi:peptidoglycan-N-acetylglucosamine deacetylase
VPELDAEGFKASFFLANVKQADVPRWRAAAGEGHELGNHTIFHACAANSVPNEERYTLEAYTAAGMVREIAQQNVLLTALDGRDRHGFAVPCGDSHVADGDYLEALRRSGLVTYARGVVTTPADLSGDVSQVDLMHIPSKGWPEGTTGDQLIDFAKQAIAGGGWAVFLFHGVGGDYLQVSDQAHRQLLGWLKDHHREVWVTTLQSAIDWAKAHGDRPQPAAR